MQHRATLPNPPATSDRSHDLPEGIGGHVPLIGPRVDRDQHHLLRHFDGLDHAIACALATPCVGVCQSHLVHDVSDSLNPVAGRLPRHQSVYEWLNILADAPVSLGEAAQTPLELRGKQHLRNAPTTHSLARPTAPRPGARPRVAPPPTRSERSPRREPARRSRERPTPFGGGPGGTPRGHRLSLGGRVGGTVDLQGSLLWGSLARQTASWLVLTGGPYGTGRSSTRRAALGSSSRAVAAAADSSTRYARLTGPRSMTRANVLRPLAGFVTRTTVPNG